MISTKVVIKNDFTNLLENLQIYVNKRLLDRSKNLSKQVKTEIKSMIYKSFGLHKKTGALKESVQEIPAEQKENSFIFGVTIGDENTPHLKTHVGKKGSFQFIVPKKSKFLTIPIKGGPAYKARSKDKTVAELGGRNAFCIVKNKETGKLYLIFRKDKEAKPVFALVKNVKVPRRVFPEEIKARILPKLQQTVVDTWEYYINRYLQGKEIR